MWAKQYATAKERDEGAKKEIFKLESVLKRREEQKKKIVAALKRVENEIASLVKEIESRKKWVCFVLCFVVYQSIVLFCFLFFCLFCFVLFCFVLFCFVLFCFVSFYFEVGFLFHLFSCNSILLLDGRNKAKESLDKAKDL